MKFTNTEVSVKTLIYKLEDLVEISRKKGDDVTYVQVSYLLESDKKSFMDEVLRQIKQLDYDIIKEYAEEDLDVGRFRSKIVSRRKIKGSTRYANEFKEIKRVCLNNQTRIIELNIKNLSLVD